MSSNQFPYKPPKKDGNSLLIGIIAVAVIAVLIIGSIIVAQKGSGEKFFKFNIGQESEESNKTTENNVPTPGQENEGPKITTEKVNNSQTEIVNVDLGEVSNIPRAIKEYIKTKIKPDFKGEVSDKPSYNDSQDFLSEGDNMKYLIKNPTGKLKGVYFDGGNKRYGSAYSAQRTLEELKNMTNDANKMYIFKATQKPFFIEEFELDVLYDVNTAIKTYIKANIDPEFDSDISSTQSYNSNKYTSKRYINLPIKQPPAGVKAVYFDGGERDISS
ncbi:MAG: hypothetical protein U9532_03180 ['Conium maculatum' witches'-broom phytoplasma]|nr:hypothetical protein ['Conium maculatum' witches'-broom phytoplasma]